MDTGSSPVISKSAFRLPPRGADWVTLKSEKILQDDAVVAIKAHNLEVGGSSPPPARDMWLYTSTWYILGNAKMQPKKN